MKDEHLRVALRLLLVPVQGGKGAHPRQPVEQVRRLCPVKGVGGHEVANGRGISHREFSIAHVLFQWSAARLFMDDVP
jgi:hypothetical protein